MIDENGYRLNVGIVLLNDQNQAFWGRRKGEDSWQFPQGGIYDNEEADDAMFRELNEELGLSRKHVQMLGKTSDWLYYDVPNTHSRVRNSNYRGQKQIWYLLRFLGPTHAINVKYHKEQEFDAWRWIEYWQPIDLVIPFKQDVYTKALTQLAKLINLNK